MRDVSWSDMFGQGMGLRCRTPLAHVRTWLRTYPVSVATPAVGVVPASATMTR